jgi:hypothetical protein
MVQTFKIIKGLEAIPVERFLLLSVPIHEVICANLLNLVVIHHLDYDIFLEANYK